jgi:hypothetical protein
MADVTLQALASLLGRITQEAAVASPSQRDQALRLLHGGASLEEIAEEVSVRLQVLEDLREARDQLENHVRAYMDSSDRLIRCNEVLASLSEQPEELGRTELWRMIQRLVDDIAPFAGSDELQALDDDFTTQITTFDENLKDASGRVLGMTNPANAPQGREVAAQVYESVGLMRDQARFVADQCKKRAKNWLKDLNNLVMDIFRRIEFIKEEARKSGFMTQPVAHGVPHIEQGAYGRGPALEYGPNQLREDETSEREGRIVQPASPDPGLRLRQKE